MTLDAPRDAVLWQEQATWPSVADDPGPLPRRVDTVVVGGGYGGLAAAQTLAEAGRHVLVLERGRLGDGAHARNGGMAIPELKAGPATLERKLGPLGRRLHAEVDEAFDHLEARIAGTGAPGTGIDCHYARTGQLYLAHTSRLTDHLRHVADEHRAAGQPVRFVERADLGGEIGSEAFHGAVLYDRTGGLHPAELHAGLARHAIAAGAVVRDRCPATGLEERGRGHRVHTPHGPVDADHVIVATNAEADGLLPELRRRVLPIGSFIVATEPLPPELQDELSPRRRMFVDTKELLFYWRLAPDGRLLFGGRRSLSTTTVADAGAYLAASMRRIHPQLAQVPITHRWGGRVAITLDRLPHVGQLRGAWYLTGCNGSGVSLNTWLGHRLAETVLGRTPPPAFAELPHRPIPLHRLRRLYLPAVGRWYQRRDRP